MVGFFGVGLVVFEIVDCGFDFVVCVFVWVDCIDVVVDGL